MTTSLNDTRFELEDIGQQMGALASLSESVATSLGNAFTQGVAKGQSFETVLKNIGAQLQNLVLKAALKPLDSVLSSGVSALLGTFNRGLSGAGGPLADSIASMGPLTGFASGGVVSAPTYFPMTGGWGVAGEAGAEAILPLARGADGRLGVRAQAGARPVSVNVTISTPDADSFRRSQAQVSAALARAVARGHRAM